jgi:hypothetical protein
MTTISDQGSLWLAAGSRIGFEVVAPCRVTLNDGRIVQATALVKVGSPNGMVIDPRWSVIEPFADQLVAEGFGYSAIEIGENDDDSDLIDLIRDWDGHWPSP